MIATGRRLSARLFAVVALGAAATALAAVDDRGVCGAQPPKPETIAACTRIIASIQTSAHDRSLAHLFRALAKRAHDDIAGALADDSEAIKLDPTNATAYRNRGALFVDAGELTHAIADFDRAVSIDPNDALALYRRGQAKRKSGDTAGGDADIAAAKALKPDIADAP